jgi:hypothetical protein
MADVHISEVETKLAPINVELWRVKIGNHDNHTILVLQLNPYLDNNESDSCTHSLTTVTMIGNVTMETKVRSLP